MARKKNKTEEEGFIDWRVAIAGKVVNDAPNVHPDIKAGERFYGLTSIEHPEHNRLSFVTPDPRSLFFNVAVQSAREAKRLRKTLALQGGVLPGGQRSKMVMMENSPHLFDYFENCMVAVTFSFQTIEVFCNRIIGKEVATTFHLARRDKEFDFTASELERFTTTEEKLCTVLPSLLGVGSPKGLAVWEKFKTLKAIRDLSVHFKSDQTQSPVDKTSLFYRLFQTDAENYPEFTLELIEHYASPKIQDFWLRHAREQLDSL